MRVKEAMHKTVRTIAPDRPLSEAADLMKRFGIEHLVVVDHRAPVGVLSHADIVARSGDGTVESAMTSGVVTINDDELISHAANLMRGHDIKSLVVTKGEKLEGIITATDVLEVISRTGHKERMVLRDRGPKKRYSRKSPPPAKHS